MKIAGLQKTSLLDYPDQICATVFTMGCNFRCPFCHNASLALPNKSSDLLGEQEIFAFLEKRKGLLDAVCVTGGEPLLQLDIEAFLSDIKKMGYLIKLDTNGSFPNQMISLVERGLVDYVAMDIKNTLEKYPVTAGGTQVDVASIQESVSYLKREQVSFEFRTTVIRELHNQEDFSVIGEWLARTKHYYLQMYVESPDIIAPGLHAHTREEMEAFAAILANYSIGAKLRGENP
ncbi:MAG: pyruvate formate lyase activating enzyme [Clostridiales bacterium]|nr:pyruvate formate lyase activating enzyme [Clostridiales bacterium]